MSAGARGERLEVQEVTDAARGCEARRGLSPMRVATALLALLGLVGCESEGHVLSVDLQSDLVAGAEVVLVETTLEPTGASTPYRRMHGTLQGAPLLDGLRVADFEGLGDGQHVLQVALRGLDGRVVATRTVDLVLAQNFAVTVVVTRSCVNVECGDGLTCQGGACISPRCTPETPEECPTPECSAEIACAAPAAGCAVAECRGGICLSLEAESSTCTEAQFCLPERGCIDRPSLPDAGPLDAGPLDGSVPQIPEVPSPRLPARSEAVGRRDFTTVPLKLAWWSSPGTDTYELELASDLGFTAPLGQIEVSAPDVYHELTSVFAPGKVYWRVRACNEVGCSAFSPPIWFRAGVSPGDLAGAPDGVAELVVGTAGSAGHVVIYQGGGGSFPRHRAPRALDLVDAAFGSALASGDFDGDGQPELAVGAYLASFGAGTEQGTVVLFQGGEAPSPDASPTELLRLTSPDSATMSSLHFGRALLAPGDLNGDGRDELVVGQPRDPAVDLPGAVFVYFGGESGLEAAAQRLTMPGASGGDELGYALAGGDFNGDGYVDLVVGAPAAGAGRGRLFFYAGGSEAHLDLGPAVELIVPESAPDEELGRALAAVGDLQSDGHVDLLAGAPGFGAGRGRALLLLGSYLGPGREPARPNLVVDAPSGVGAGGRFGAVLSGGGNTDLLGSRDFAIAAPADGAGSVWLYRSNVIFPWRLPTPEPITDGAAPEGRFGACLVLRADHDGDHLADLVVGHPGPTGGAPPDGEVRIYEGVDAPELLGTLTEMDTMVEAGGACL